jgi:hypothetical protein
MDSSDVAIATYNREDMIWNMAELLGNKKAKTAA